MVSTKKIRNNSTERDFSKVKDRSFVISCGTGCAMAHNVKKISQINPFLIKVTFEIEMYVNEELTETFDDTLIFKYNIYSALDKINRENETENFIEGIPPEVYTKLAGICENDDIIENLQNLSTTSY